MEKKKLKLKKITISDLNKTIDKKSLGKIKGGTDCSFGSAVYGHGSSNCGTMSDALGTRTSCCFLWTTDYCVGS